MTENVVRFSLKSLKWKTKTQWNEQGNKYYILFIYLFIKEKDPMWHIFEHKSMSTPSS